MISTASAPVDLSPRHYRACLRLIDERHADNLDDAADLLAWLIICGTPAADVPTMDADMLALVTHNARSRATHAHRNGAA